MDDHEEDLDWCSSLSKEEVAKQIAETVSI